MGLGQINWDTGSLVLVIERPLQQRPSLSEFQDKAEAFFGLIGVAMEGYSRFVLPSNSRRVPKEGKLRLCQSLLSLRPDFRTTLTQFPRCSPVYKALVIPLSWLDAGVGSTSGNRLT